MSRPGPSARRHRAAARERHRLARLEARLLLAPRHRQPSPRSAPAPRPRPEPCCAMPPCCARRALPTSRPAPATHALLHRRAAREPLAYILGRREFWSLIFAVSPATLIPRPNSETLIEAALAAFARPRPAAPHPRPRHRHRLPAARGACTNSRPRSASASTARPTPRPWPAPTPPRWAGRPGRLPVRRLGAALAGRFDLSCAIRPTSPPRDIDGLMPEVARHEPAGALDGGRRRAGGLSPDYPGPAAICSRPDGVAVRGAGQSARRQAVTALAAQAGLSPQLGPIWPASRVPWCCNRRAEHEKTVWHQGCGGLACGRWQGPPRCGGSWAAWPTRSPSG